MTGRRRTGMSRPHRPTLREEAELSPPTDVPADIEVKSLTGSAGETWRLTGVWRHQTAVEASRKLTALAGKARAGGALEIDLSAVTVMDTAGAWIVRKLISERQDAGSSV